MDEGTKTRECWLSTDDNPFDPLDEQQSDDWESFDEDHGYFSTNLLMRVAKVHPEFSDAQNDEEIERAIDAIVGWKIPIINTKGKEAHFIKYVHE